MTATALVKKSPQMIVQMAQAAPLTEADTVKKMVEGQLLLSLNKITHYFKKWSTANGVLKKSIVNTKT